MSTPLKWPIYRQKSAAQRKVILTKILRAVDQLSNDELILLFNFLFDDLDKRLLYFISVYLTSKKYIDFITLLPSNVVLKILAKVDPVTLNSLGHVSQAWRAQSKVWCPLAEITENLFIGQLPVEEERYVGRVSARNFDGKPHRI